MMLFLQLLINGIIRGFIYSVMALGFAIIYRSFKFFHIAHGAIYTLSAYLFFTFIKSIGFSLYLSILLTFISICIVAFFMEHFIFNQLRKKNASSSVLLIVSLGLYIFIINLIALIYGNETKIIFSGLSQSYEMGRIIITHIQLLQLLISLVVFGLVFYFLKFSKIGNSINAYSDNPVLAEVIGIDIKKLRNIAFIYGSVLACIASLLISMDVGMDPWGGIEMFLVGAVAMIIGGLKRWHGTLVGGLILGIAQATAIWKFSFKWQDTLTFSLLILFLLFRPEGILSQKTRAEI